MDTERETTAQPLLLLAVDGVINDLNSAMKIRPFGADAAIRAKELGVKLVRSHGFWLTIPETMPELIGELASHFETWWCTTWRSNANDEIAQHLGVGPFPVVDDGGRALSQKYKSEAARPLIEAALAAGRPVVWIDDFKGNLPEIENVTFVDTSEFGVLRWSDIPEELLVPAV